MSDDSRKYALLDDLAEEFAARYRRGERPSLAEYLQRYPDLADDLREMLPAMAEVEQVKEDVASAEKGAPPAPMPQLGDFRLLREIGHGGMGVVYEAEQLSLGRHVALKVLSRQLLIDNRTKGRFEREAKAAAKLHHTNIVPVFGVGEHEGLPYYVMQFIQGTGLHVVIDELVRMEPSFKSVAASPPVGNRRSAAVIAQSMPARERHTANNGPGAACAEGEVPGPVATESPSRAKSSRYDLFSISSSIHLPGQGDSSSGSRGRRLTYWQSVARVGLQVAEALEY